MNRRSTALAGGLATLLASAATVLLATGVGFAASTHPAASANETFNLMTTQPSSARYSLIASGVFTAGGVDIAGNTTDTAKFPAGSFKIHHGGTPKIIKESVNAKTCLAFFEAKAPFTIGSGTGAYKGITGSGTATITELGIAARNKQGACNFNANPLVNEETIVGKAHVTL